MKNRTALVLMGLVSSIIFFGISFTKNYALLGALIGFGAGLFNIQWLFWDANKALDQDIYAAVRIYRKSLFSRLGMVTLVVATVGRFRPDWLFFLALGIAAGIIIPLILAIKHQIYDGRG
jgi:nicotinamide riboside transporter PnuC